MSFLALSDLTPVMDTPTPAPSSTFSQGQVLSDRFRIERLIAAGGMGEVYEALDLTLQERIALKTVHPEIARDESAVERFMREVYLARKVTHPNVCRIFDVFFHHPDASDLDAADPGDGEMPTAFVTMELLPGETLAQRLHREGPMSPEEAMPLIRQMASALDAAHQAGILHRDFKSQNVTLVPAPQMDGGARAVITDFGLASAVSSSDGVYDEDGFIMGTPAYMAVECLLGRDVTPAADLYSLGVVIYEMTTGRLPFPNQGTSDEIESGSSTTLRSLGARPPSPREIVSYYDPAWEIAVMRCLEREPEDRFASAGELLQALETPVSRLPPALHSVVLGLILILFLSPGAFLLLRQFPRGDDTQMMQKRNAVALLGFDNLSPNQNTDWLAAALLEMLTAELGSGSGLQIIPSENVQRLQPSFQLPDTGSLAPDTLKELRRRLGADHVVTGSYYAAGNLPDEEIRLTIRHQRTLPGGDLTILQETSTKADLLVLVERVGFQLQEVLGVSGTSTAGSIRSVLPKNPEAAQFYIEGLARLRLYDAATAQELLQRAAELESDSPRIHAALASAAEALGFDSLAEKEALLAFELSGDLPQAERFFIEGRYYETANDWDQAVRIYRSLHLFYADNLEYGLRLAAAETSADQGMQALATLARLRQLTAPYADDPRIDLQESRTARRLGELERAHSAAERAAEKGTEVGAWSLVANARLEEARSLRRLGETKRCLEAVIAARRIFSDIGDFSGVARTLNLTGNVLAGQGSSSKAISVYEEALAIQQRIGSRQGASSVLNNLAIVLGEQGDFAGALRYYEKSLEIDRELEDRRGVAISLNNIAEIRKNQGLYEEAKKLYDESLAVFEKLDNPLQVALLHLNIGDLARLRGDLVEAGAFLDLAIRVHREYDEKSGLAESLYAKGTVLRAGGDVRAARQSYRESLELQQEIGESGDAALTRLALAHLDAEEGHWQEASANSVLLVRELGDLGRRDEAALAATLGVHTSLLDGKIEQAEKLYDEAERLGEGSQRVEIRLRLALARARLLAALSEIEESQSVLEGIAAEASKDGYFSIELEARLALAENELAAGRIASGARRAIELTRMAEQRGWLQIAARSRALLGSD